MTRPFAILIRKPAFAPSVAGLALLIALAPIRLPAANTPLYQRIDATLAASGIAPTPPTADDAAFLRRAFLDLTGRIPSTGAARAFLADTDPDKRAKWIDRLLASPEHIRHMAISFDVTWVERRSDPHVKADAWRDFLHSRFATNAPYTSLAASVIAAEGADPKKNGPAKFLLAREAEPNALTRDVSRMFLGQDLQCAQCHDHPRIDDYTMREYYGVNAFLNRSYLFRPDKNKPGVIAEKPTGEADYKSAFTQAAGRSKPRLPGESEITEPVVAKDKEYRVKPDKKNKKLRPVPTYSRRAELARLFAKGDNPQFRRNIANRLWAHMMGRGIVEPVDFHHSDNPPTHPELLELLADEFAAMNFDIRAFLRELALSQTYQRGFDLPTATENSSTAAEQRLANLDSDYERLGNAAGAAIEAFEQFKAAIETKQSELGTAKQSIAAKEKNVAELTKARDAARKPADAAAKPFAKESGRLATLAEAAAKATKAAAELKDDKELARAAAVLEDRRRTLAAEVASLKADVDAKKATLGEAEKKLAAATGDLKSTKEQVARLEAGLQGLRARFNAEDKKRVDAKLAASFAKQRRDAARELVEIARLESESTRLGRQIDTFQRELRDADRKFADHSAAAPRLAAKLPAAQLELNRILERKKADVGAIALARTELKDIETQLGKADAGQPTKQGDRADALLASQRRLESSLTGLEAQSQELRDAFLRAGKALVEAKARIRGNSLQLDAEGLRRAELSTMLNEFRGKRETLAAKLDAAGMEHADSLSARFAIGGLTPLSPEQLCWSMLEATGEAAKQARAGAAEFDKKNPLKDGAKSTPAREAERAKHIEQYVYGKLKAQEGNFVSLFGSAAGSPQNAFFATPDQALFFANGGNVRGWLNPSSGNLTDRLSKLEDPAAFAEELYLAVLTRMPTPSEIADVKAQLAAHGKDRRTAAQELAWALFTSIEFRFRH